MTTPPAPPSQREWTLRSEGSHLPRTSPLSAAFLAVVGAVGLLIVGLTVAAAVALSKRAETVYGGRADVVFVGLGDDSSDVRDRTLNTQRELVLSRAVLVPVARSVRRPLADVRDAVDVSLAPDDLVRITASDTDPRTARSLAGRVAKDYIGVNGGLSAEQRAAEKLIQDQILVVRERLRRSPEDQRYIFTDRVNRLEDQLLEQRVERLSQPAPAPRLLTAPYVLDDPLSPKPLRAAAVGLVLGSVLATVVIVVLLRRRWRRAG